MSIAISLSCNAFISKMNTLLSVIPILTGLLTSIKYASSILCYDCNSAFDHRCGEQFDTFSLGIVNCSLRDPLEHIEPIQSTLCRSIKIELNDKVRVVRQCGYLAENVTIPSCRRVVGTGNLFTTYCTCNTDLCNHAPSNILCTFVLLTVFISMYLF